MNRLLFILISIITVFVFVNKSFIKPLRRPPLQPTQALTYDNHLQISNHPITNCPISNCKYSIFIPYWSIPEDIPEIKAPQITNNELPITNYIYFGISADENGINKNEPGYQNLTAEPPRLDTFNNDKTSEVKTLLTLRMTNTDLNFEILDDNQLQQKMIAQTIEIAKEYSFSGIVLDLEVSSLPSQTIINQITDFVNKFSIATKSKKLILDMTIYGDNFYRKRPYDLEKLRQYVNQFFVMAYDFHKVLGAPGPNFPLNGRERYGYDLEKAIGDFLSVIPSNKLTFVFGLYGYDWVVDEKERPVKQARALTLKQIRNKFISTTIYIINKDTLSQESFIKYSDKNNNQHILWYEDEKSIEKKQGFLKSKGISNFAYWAWGYY
jgi:spore germination protein YaaH